MLGEQTDQHRVPELPVPALAPTRTAVADSPPPVPRRDLVFRNGLGGFTRDGHEYVITLASGQATPAPWVNLLVNPTFGTVISERGDACTWVENALEFRLTPWNNDPVQDTGGEAFHVRDEQTGQFWSPPLLPLRLGALRDSSWVRLHGFRAHRKRHRSRAVDLRRDGRTGEVRRPETAQRLRPPVCFSATGFWEWVLGDQRAKSLLHVQTELDLKTDALLAFNLYNTEFPGRIAFVDMNDTTRTITGDRKEFIGRNGSLEHPAAPSVRAFRARSAPASIPATPSKSPSTSRSARKGK